jgi:hypothetical protein
MQPKTAHHGHFDTLCALVDVSERDDRKWAGRIVTIDFDKVASKIQSLAFRLHSVKRFSQ